MAQRSTIREVQLELIQLAERGGDPSPVLEPIGAAWRAAQRAQYASGKGWAPVSDEHQQAKSRKGKGSRTGVYTGGLESSMTSEGDRYYIERFTRDKSFIVGSANPVANLFGGKHRTRDQPRRRPYRMTAAMRRQWLEWVQAYLVDGTLP